jgi:hypothetical protein
MNHKFVSEQAGKWALLRCWMTSSEIVVRGRRPGMTSWHIRYLWLCNKLHTQEWWPPAGSHFSGSARGPLEGTASTAFSWRYQTASSDQHKPVSPDVLVPAVSCFTEFARSELFQASNLVCPEPFWDNGIIPCWWRHRNYPKRLTSELTQLVF